MTNVIIQYDGTEGQKREHYDRMIKFLIETSRLYHPEYGPCDALKNGACAECFTRFELLANRVAMLEKKLAIATCWIRKDLCPDGPLKRADNGEIGCCVSHVALKEIGDE